MQRALLPPHWPTAACRVPASPISCLAPRWLARATCSAGQEVSISYGSWPTDVFLLFFGFVPADNPHDAGERRHAPHMHRQRSARTDVAPSCAPCLRLRLPCGLPAISPAAVLFYDLFDLTTFQHRQAGAAAAAGGAAVAEAAVQQLEASVGAPRQQFTRCGRRRSLERGTVAVVVIALALTTSPMLFCCFCCCRMVATAQGIDERLLQAAQALLAAGRGSPDGRPMSVADFLGQRCRQLLDALPTSASEDMALLREAGAVAEAVAGAAEAEGGERELAQQRLITALRYRLGKKLVLQATLDALG